MAHDRPSPDQPLAGRKAAAVRPQLSACCGAHVTFVEDVLCCKSCYQEAPLTKEGDCPWTSTS